MTMMLPQEKHEVAVKDQSRRSHITSARSFRTTASLTMTDAGHTMDGTKLVYSQRPVLQWVRTSTGLHMRWTPSEV